MSHQSALDQQYQQYHLKLLRAFAAQVSQQLPFAHSECSAEDREFLNDLHALREAQNHSAQFLTNGQQLLCRVIASYPHITPLLYRDLLWFFGGDCLHFMPDDEISRYQQLDEMRHDASHEGSEFSYENARAKVFGLH